MGESNHSDFKGRLEELIDQNLHHEHLDNTFLARKMLLSEAQFYRLVKKHYHLSPNALIRNRRLCEANRKLNMYKDVTVREVAFSVGYSHVGYFIRRYEELFGTRPGERIVSGLY